MKFSTITTKALLSWAALFLIMTATTSCIFPTEIVDRTKNFRRDGVYHKVQKGETLYRIAAAYKVSVTKIQKANDIKDPTKIEAGKSLFIPGAKKVVRVAKVIDTNTKPKVNNNQKPKTNNKPKTNQKPKTTGPCNTGKKKLATPVTKAVLTSKFGLRHGRAHDGIDLAAPTGTPILAADDGVVIFEGKIGGYGNVIIIKHEGNVKTVYSHNRKHYVKQGDMVKREQKIAEVGTSGNATGPHLHFEVRCGSKAIDPQPFLP